MLNEFKTTINDKNVNLLVYDHNYLNKNHRMMSTVELVNQLVLCFKYRGQRLDSLVMSLDESIIDRVLTSVYFDVDRELQHAFLTTVYLPIMISYKTNPKFENRYLNPSIAFGIQPIHFGSELARYIYNTLEVSFYNEDEASYYDDNIYNITNRIANYMVDKLRMILPNILNIYKRTYDGSDNRNGDAQIGINLKLIRGMFSGEVLRVCNSIYVQNGESLYSKMYHNREDVLKSIEAIIDNFYNNTFKEL